MKPQSRKSQLRGMAPEVTGTFMQLSHYSGLFLLIFGFALSGCGDDVKSTAEDACSLIPGDIVISEIMPDPMGDDKYLEWIELYNVSASVEVLDRIRVEFVTTNDAGVVTVKEQYLDGAGAVSAQSYYVIGHGVVGVAPIDYSYFREDGNENISTLSQEASTIRIWCGDTLIDEASYGEGFAAPMPEEGRSIAFDGSVAPDALLNDDSKWWCEGTELYDGANYGTPGMRNAACGFAWCEEGVAAREVVASQAGNLIITEVYADALGEEVTEEWIEVFVESSTGLDLNGLSLEITTFNDEGVPTVNVAKIDATECLPVAGGDYIVLGKSQDRDLNGDVEVDAILDGLNLTNSKALTLRLLYFDVVVDEALVPVASATGVSNGLDPLRLSVGATGNDLASAFCAQRNETIFDGTGTPGFANDNCTFSCLGGSGMRSTILPQAGDLIISEIMMDPDGADTGKEWIELYVAGSTAVDLNGLVISQEHYDVNGGIKTSLVEGDNCEVALPGTWVVVVASDLIADNVGMSYDAVALGLSFYDDKGITDIKIEAGGVLIDSASVPERDSEGDSVGVDPLRTSDAQNDIDTNFCSASTLYYTLDTDNDFGTPGAQNDSCKWSCDDGGTLRETHLLSASGEIFITEVFADPSGADGVQEWLEVYATNAIDLNGLRMEIVNISTDSTRNATLVSTSCVGASASDYFVLGASTDTSLNGNVAVDGLMDGSFSFYNSEELRISLYMGDVLIDEALLPASSVGVSSSLNPLTNTDSANGDMTNFCDSTTTDVFDGTGTPGQANDSCL